MCTTIACMRGLKYALIVEQQTNVRKFWLKYQTCHCKYRSDINQVEFWLELVKLVFDLLKSQRKLKKSSTLIYLIHSDLVSLEKNQHLTRKVSVSRMKTRFSHIPVNNLVSLISRNRRLFKKKICNSSNERIARKRVMSNVSFAKN